MGDLADLRPGTHRRGTGQPRPRRHRYVSVSLRDRAASGVHRLASLRTPQAVREISRLHVFDSLVAAIAIEEGLTLVTKNRKHFGMIEGLNVEVPQY